MCKNLLIAACACLLAWPALAQGGDEPWRGYRFVLSIEGNSDSVMYLGNYYAGRTYATDTARRDRKGRFVFEQKSRPIYPGLYFFSNPKGDYVEFIVYREKPSMTFSTREGQWTEGMSVKGSRQNELFYGYHRLNRRYYDMLDAAKATLPDSAYKAFSDSVMHELDSVKVALIRNNPGTLLALMMNATRTPATPSADSTGRALSDKERYFYFLDHYWDNMALNDDALVRTPDLIFHKRVMDYFDRYLRNATPEDIIPRIDTLLAKAKPSRENFKYLVHTLSEKYLQSNIMSYDAIYVHLIQAYYATGQAFWASPSTIDDNVERANKWERLLIGKDAPELILRSADGTPHSLHALRSKYTLLVFWSPTCGHCKVMVPALYQKFMIYKDKYDIDAFTILSEPDEHTHGLWLKFIQDHNMNDDRWLNLDGAECNIDWHEVYDVVTTPQIYLLDKDKHILAKKLNAELLEKVLQALEGA